MSVDDSFVRAVQRFLLSVGAIVVSTVLVVGGLSGVAWAGNSDEKSKTGMAEALDLVEDSDGDGDLDRPDAAAASSTARLVDKKVEDLSQRTETTRVFANADGTWSSQEYLTPARIQRDNKWVDVDYNLLKQPDGSWAPKASPVDVTVNGGGAREAARVTFDDGDSLAVTWPEALPEPTVKGGVATYNLSASTDLVVTTTANGVNAHIRLNEAPVEDDPVFKLGLRADGVEVSKSGTGLKVEDGEGDALARTAPLVAWDAKTDAAGDPAGLVPLKSVLTEVADSGDVTQHELGLTAPEGFLEDPATKYPVVIDPQIYGMPPVRDTYVRSGDASSRGNEPELLVGKIAGSATNTASRAFIKHSSGFLTGKQVISAQLKLVQYYAYDCNGARTVNLYPVTADWSANMIWTNGVPGATSAYGAALNQTAGASGCGTSWVSADITGMVQAWASGAIPNNGLRMSSISEGAAAYGRKFCSMDASSSHGACNTWQHAPQINVTYELPAPPVDPDPEPGLPGMTPYGVDEYMLQDLQDIAALEGITLSQAVAQYGWQNDFASAAAQVAEAHPNEFAAARMNESATPGGVIELTEDAPPSVIAAVESETASLAEDVSVEADATYSEPEVLEVVSQANEAVIAAAGTENVTTYYDEQSHVIRANVGGVTASESSLETAVQTQLDSTLPPLQVPGVEVTVGTPSVGEAETLRGGLEQSDPHLGDRCTTGWPVQGTFLGRFQYGIVTAAHCNDDADMTRVNGKDDALRVSILVAQYKKGDISYQEKGSDGVGKSFVFKADKAPRAIKGMRKPVKGQYLCLFGRTTLGSKDGKRTCAKVEKLNTSRGKYGGMVSMSRNVGIPGDSGGPWYSGAYAYGVHSGSHSRVPFGKTHSQFTPLSGVLSSMGFTVRSN